MSFETATDSGQTLNDLPLTDLKGVGSKLQEKLNRLGIFSQLDLLFHLPYRYQDRTRITPIGSLSIGQAVVVEGDVRGASVVFGKRRALIARIQDGTGTLTLRFFHFTAAQKNQFKSGNRIRCYGEIRPGSTGLEMFHPEYRLFDVDSPPPLEDKLTPLYPTTEGLNQTRLRQLVEQVLPKVHNLVDWIPEEMTTPLGMPSLTQAVLDLHQPETDSQLLQLLDGEHPSQRRLAFEELLAHNLSLQQLKREAQKEQAPALSASQQLQPTLVDRLPFKLTDAQLRVITEIGQDLTQPHPMMRLVQGDVGSGKTLVALMAGLQAVERGYQMALMAPTEILAEQHFNNIFSLVEPLGLTVAWLVGKQTKKQRESQLELIASGEAQIIVGTHALFQDGVHFHNLALMIVDEQHRFGVHQRLALREKSRHQGLVPHQLIMTATPIPRTLAMSAYADLDCSIIDELPAGRKPVQTVVISDQRRHEVVQRVQTACAEGRQVYWVCTLIEESDELQCQAAEDTALQLATALPQLRVGLVHGRMKANEKSDVMKRFKQHELDLLVATTVIEVGVDVPNASVMIIENPERLGLAQLHQLRGRVGRGEAESFCLLMYSHPLSQQGKERLAIMRETSDGFRIAEKDLELRGPGEVLGTRQTGMMAFRVADLERDQDLLDQIPDVADQLTQRYPNHIAPLIKRWLPEKDKFARV